MGYENRIISDIGQDLGLNAGDVRRALMDEHREGNRPLTEKKQVRMKRKFKDYFDLDVLVKHIVVEINSFCANSPKESLAQLFIAWIEEHMPDNKHVVFDEETLAMIEVDVAFVTA